MSKSESVKKHYACQDPAPGGRIEFRFQMPEEKYLCDEWVKEVRRKTGLRKDEVLIKALNLLRKNFDEKGNLI